MKRIIEANDISFSYGKGDRILADVSFEVYERDFIGLIGPNGGGKTTLLKMILGLLRPDAGEITVFDSTGSEARKHIGYVPQYSKIDLDYPISVLEVVLSGFLGKKRLGSRYTREEKVRAEEALEDMRLLELKHRAIGELSGGQRQRVMIARALVRNPKLLLLDEPTNNVDVESGKNLYELLSELNKKMAIILVSHDVDVVSRHVKRVFCLNKRLVCSDACDIEAKDINENMVQIRHRPECIIHEGE